MDGLKPQLVHLWYKAGQLAEGGAQAPSSHGPEPCRSHSWTVRLSSGWAVRTIHSTSGDARAPSLGCPVPHRTPPSPLPCNHPPPPSFSLPFNRLYQSNCICVLPGSVHLHLPPFPHPLSIEHYQSDPITGSLGTLAGPDALAVSPQQSHWPTR